MSDTLVSSLMLDFQILRAPKSSLSSASIYWLKNTTKKHVQQNKSNGTASTLMPLIDALEKYK